MDIKQKRCEGVEWPYQAQDRITGIQQEVILVNTVVNLRVTSKTRNFLTSLVTMGFSGILLHGVSFAITLNFIWLSYE
jgi:hypothetical protein